MTKTEIKANEIASLIMRNGHHEKTAENQKKDLAKAALKMASYEVTTIEVLHEQIAALETVIKKLQDSLVHNTDDLFRVQNEIKKVKYVLTKHYTTAANQTDYKNGIARNEIAEIIKELGYNSIFQTPLQ